MDLEAFHSLYIKPMSLSLDSSRESGGVYQPFGGLQRSLSERKEASEIIDDRNEQLFVESAKI